MQKLLAFLNNADARAWRTIVVSVALLAIVVAMIVLGKTGILGISDNIEIWLEGLRTGLDRLPEDRREEVLAALLDFGAAASVHGPTAVAAAG